MILRCPRPLFVLVFWAGPGGTGGRVPGGGAYGYTVYCSLIGAKRNTLPSACDTSKVGTVKFNKNVFLNK